MPYIDIVLVTRVRKTIERKGEMCDIAGGAMVPSRSEYEVDATDFDVAVVPWDTGAVVKLRRRKLCGDSSLLYAFAFGPGTMDTCWV